jgi:hypothetical protein
MKYGETQFSPLLMHALEILPELLLYYDDVKNLNFNDAKNMTMNEIRAKKQYLNSLRSQIEETLEDEQYFHGLSKIKMLKLSRKAPILPHTH